MPTRFSVIVPVGPQRTAPVLPSLAQLEFPSDAYEVIVERGPSPSRNRNRGIAQASGDVLAFVDDDCVVEPDWLARAAAFFDTHPEHEVVGGPQLTPPSDGVLARASGHALASRLGAWRMSRRYRRAHLDLDATETVLTSANLFVRRSALARCGLFDPRLWPNEETELLHRIVNTGGRLAYDPQVVVRHHRRPSLRELAGQCFRYGTGRARQAWLTGVRPGVGVLVPLAFLAYLSLLPFLLAAGVVAAAPLVAYAALVGAWSVGTAVRAREVVLVGALPAAVIVIHMSYPAGYAAEWARLAFGGELDEVGASRSPQRPSRRSSRHSRIASKP
jgi:GT2 family glycosyltransferase